MEWLQAHLGSGLVSVASFLSVLGEETVMAALLGFLYWCVDKEYGKTVGVNVITAAVWAPMVKNLVLRRRPYCDHPGIRCLRPVEASADILDLKAQGYSFPSGHSVNAAAAYVSLPLGRPGKAALRVLAVLLPLLVGVSRVCLGVHYPTDVLAGWAFGLLIVLVLSWVQKRVRRKKLMYLILLLTGVPGWFFCASSDFYSAYGLMLGFFAAILFEERFVRFSNTRSVPRCILRVLGGLLVFFGLNSLLKLPFSSDFLASGSLASHLVRTARYTVVTFADMGLYPMLFRLTERIGKKPAVSDGTSAGSGEKL